MPMIKNNVVYLSTDEACQFLGVTRQTVNRLVREKRLHQYKQGISRTIYYKQSELETLTDIRPIETEE